MNSTTRSQPVLAALRPWPYGPPLRGRAPRGEAGLRVAPRGQAVPARHTAATGPLSSGLATAPAGGRARIQLFCCR